MTAIETVSHECPVCHQSTYPTELTVELVTFEKVGDVIVDQHWHRDCYDDAIRMAMHETNPKAEGIYA